MSILNHAYCNGSIVPILLFSTLFLIQVSGDLVTVFVFDYTDKSPDDVSNHLILSLRIY